MRATFLARSSLVNLRFVLRGRGKALGVLCVLALVGAICESLLLASVVQAISAMSSGRDSVRLGASGLDLSASVRVVLVVAVVSAVLRGVATGIVALYGPVIAADGRERQRRELLSSFLRADWTTQSQDKAGRFLQVFSSSINEANTPVLLLSQAVPALITSLVLVAAALTLDPALTLLICAIGLAIGTSVRPIAHRATIAARHDTLAREDTAAHVSGVIAAGAEIATLGARAGAEEIANERIARAEKFFAQAAGRTRLMGTASQSMAFLLAAVGLLVLNLANRDVDYAVVGTIAVLLLRVAGLAQQVQAATSVYRSLAPFIDQVRELTAFYDERRETFGSTPFPGDFELRLSDVSYRYPGTRQPAIRVGEATIAERSFVAVVGPSGSGKSTLIQLLMRLRSPQGGHITMGGVPLDDLDESEFTKRVAYVPQAPHLVPGSILDNIVFFRSDVSEEQAVEAAKRAHVHQEIVAMEQGYQTRLDAHVDELSGGQKQRLSLARALATSPRLLVLDEPTSALDTSNEQRVLATLRELRSATTVVMITHKTSAVTSCDAVFQVRDGIMKEVGLSEFLAGRTDHPA